MPVLSDRYATQIVRAEKLEGHDEGWRTLWLAIAGVMAITLGWNVLMLSLNGISYWIATSDVEHEDRTVCGSPRGEGSFSAFCSLRDRNHADWEFDFADLVLSSFHSPATGKKKATKLLVA
jgi:hypothetical protein